MCTRGHFSQRESSTCFLSYSYIPNQHLPYLPHSPHYSLHLCSTPYIHTYIHIYIRMYYHTAHRQRTGSRYIHTVQYHHHHNRRQGPGMYARMIIIIFSPPLPEERKRGIYGNLPTRYNNSTSTLDLIRETVSSHSSYPSNPCRRPFIYLFVPYLKINIRALYRIYDFTYHNNIYFLFFISPLEGFP